MTNVSKSKTMVDQNTSKMEASDTAHPLKIPKEKLYYALPRESINIFSTRLGTGRVSMHRIIV